MELSFYRKSTKEWVCNTAFFENEFLNHTTTIYQGGFIKALFDEANQSWYEGANQEETDVYYQNQKTLLAKICDENSYPYLDETQIEFDKCGFLTPCEAKYGLKGVKLRKDYKKDNQIVVSQIYELLTETKSHAGFTINNVPVSLIKKIRFYITDSYYKEKTVETLTFDVHASEAKNQNGDIVAVTFNSMKLEKYMKENRHEADVLLKSFNSTLYSWLYSAYGSIYTKYLDTGVSTELVSAFENETNPTNLFILNKIVEEQDLAVLLGPMPVYPQITVKELIIMNLQ